MVAFRGHFDGKVVVPDEPVSLTPGQRVTVHVDAPAGVAAGPDNLWDYLESIAGSIEMPPDWSAETDHYLYGTPKRNSPPNTPPREMSDRLFIDTAFAQALLNRGDQFHGVAMSLVPRMRAAENWTTEEAVLTELANAFAGADRAAAVGFIDRAYRTPNVRVVFSVDRPLFRRAVDLYRRRPDKDWGITDCISFVVMQDNRLTDALTADHHFIQAGYRALLLQP